MLDNPVALLIALIGTAGLGGFFREIVSVLSKIRAGISTKESHRKRDLVSERDYEYGRAETEARNRRRVEDYAARLRRALIEGGCEEKLPPYPTLEAVPERVLEAPAEKKPQ